MHVDKLLIIIATTVLSNPTTHADLPRDHSPEELERWFNSNDDDKNWKPQDINDGELRFLQKKPRFSPHVADNRITINDDSLQHGWVSLTQCHTALDMMPAAQIVYQNQPVRAIRIIEQNNIGKSWVEGNTVQLTHIKAQARICIQAEIKALHRMANHQYQFVTGPYRRKFLDGYFPVDLSLSIHYPASLTAQSFRPHAQPGMTIEQQRQSSRISALFEGVLISKVTFAHRQPEH